MLKTWTEIERKTKTKQLSAKYYEPGPKRHTHFDRKVFEKLLVVVQWWPWILKKKKSASHFKLHETLGVLKLHSGYLCLVPSSPYITYLLLRIVLQLYLGTCTRTILFWGRALFVYLFNWRVHLVNFSALKCVVRDSAHMVGGSS